MLDDILIVGAGLAGLFLALKLAPRRVTVLSQAPLGLASASSWAQGGLAAAMAPEDDPELHAQDTIAAGAGLVDSAVAQLIARDGSARVVDLVALGVPFAFATGAIAVLLCLVKLGPDSLTLLASRTYSFLDSYVLVSVPLFIMMASLLERAGLARDLYNAMYVWAGRLRGGVAVMTICVSVVLAARRPASVQSATIVQRPPPLRIWPKPPCS